MKEMFISSVGTEDFDKLFPVVFVLERGSQGCCIHNHLRPVLRSSPGLKDTSTTFLPLVRRYSNYVEPPK